MTRLAFILLTGVTALAVLHALLESTRAGISENDPIPFGGINDASPKIVRYAKRILARHDANSDGHLTPDEWEKMSGRPGVIDRDGDEKISLAEFVDHVREYARYRRLGGDGHAGGVVSNRAAANTTDSTSQAAGDADRGGATQEGDGDGRKPATPFYVPESRRVGGAPSWFQEHDRNGDGQLSLAEYAPTGSLDAVAAFKKLDANHDGLVTAKECARQTEGAAQENGSAAP